MAQVPDRMRVDKWLWSARFYKTRALAVEAIERGRVSVNGIEAKPSREIKPGDELTLRGGLAPRAIRVLALSLMRGPAPVAALLYQESQESIAANAHALEQRRLAPEPAHSLQGGRPTKRDRREIEQTNAWGPRWSAGIDE